MLKARALLFHFQTHTLLKSLNPIYIECGRVTRGHLKYSLTDSRISIYRQNFVFKMQYNKGLFLLLFIGSFMTFLCGY